MDRLLGQLATTVAANDAPDIIQMDEKYLREYADRGALLDLKKRRQCLDTGEFEPDTLGAGEFDGGQYGLNAGINAFAIVVNPTCSSRPPACRARTTRPGPGTTSQDGRRQITTASGGKVTGTAVTGTNEAGG